MAYHLLDKGNAQGTERVPTVVEMRKECDFSESIKNPYLKKAKKQVTIRLDEDTIAYFKALSAEKGFPYQSLINLYLRECAESFKKPEFRWVS